MAVIKSQVFGFPVNMDEADITRAKVTKDGQMYDLIDLLDDPQTDALAGLTPTADSVPYFTSETTATTTTLTAFARTLLDDANATTARATLNVGAANAVALSPLDYGGVGDGSTNDTTAIQSTLTAAASAGRPVDLLGNTWRVDSSLTVSSNTEIRNGTITFANAADGDYLFEVLGTLGSGTSFTASSRGASSIVVSSASGLAVNDWIYLRSTDAFGTGGTYRGEWTQISAIAGTTISLYGRTEDAYTTSPTFYKPTLVSNVRFRDLRLIGRGSTYDQWAIRCYLARNVLVDNIDSEFFGDRHVCFERCFDVKVVNSTMAHCDSASGLAYGVVVASGTFNATVANCSFRDMRHGVTIGAEDGVDRHVSVTGCVMRDCTDSGVDTHPQSQFVTISGNTIDIGGTASGGTGDGIVVQGANTSVTGNVVTGFTRVGILVQSLVTNSVMTDDSVTVSGNSVSFPIGSGPVYGISVQIERSVEGFRCAVTGNTVDTVAVTNSYGIHIENPTASSASMLGIAVTGNNVYTRRNAVAFITATLKFIRSSTVSGNVLESVDTTTYDVVLISAASANYIERMIITGNSLYGGRYGINNSNGSRIKADANMIQGFGTADTNGTIVGTNDNYSA